MFFSAQTVGREKIKKICESLNANIYEYPEDTKKSLSETSEKKTNIENVNEWNLPLPNVR